MDDCTIQKYVRDLIEKENTNIQVLGGVFTFGEATKVKQLLLEFYLEIVAVRDQRRKGKGVIEVLDNSKQGASWKIKVLPRCHGF